MYKRKAIVTKATNVTKSTKATKVTKSTKATKVLTSVRRLPLGVLLFKGTSWLGLNSPVDDTYLVICCPTIIIINNEVMQSYTIRRKD